MGNTITCHADAAELFERVPGSGHASRKLTVSFIQHPDGERVSMPRSSMGGGAPTLRIEGQEQWQPSNVAAICEAFVLQAEDVCGQIEHSEGLTINVDVNFTLRTASGSQLTAADDFAVAACIKRQTHTRAQLTKVCESMIRLFCGGRRASRFSLAFLDVSENLLGDEGLFAVAKGVADAAEAEVPAGLVVSPVHIAADGNGLTIVGLSKLLRCLLQTHVPMARDGLCAPGLLLARLKKVTLRNNSGIHATIGTQHAAERVVASYAAQHVASDVQILLAEDVSRPSEPVRPAASLSTHSPAPAPSHSWAPSQVQTAPSFPAPPPTPSPSFVLPSMQQQPTPQCQPPPTVRLDSQLAAASDVIVPAETEDEEGDLVVYDDEDSTGALDNSCLPPEITNESTHHLGPVHQDDDDSIFDQAAAVSEIIETSSPVPLKPQQRSAPVAAVPMAEPMMDNTRPKTTYHKKSRSRSEQQYQQQAAAPPVQNQMPHSEQLPAAEMQETYEESLGRYGDNANSPRGSQAWPMPKGFREDYEIFSPEKVDPREEDDECEEAGSGMTPTRGSANPFAVAAPSGTHRRAENNHASEQPLQQVRRGREQPPAPALLSVTLEEEFQRTFVVVLSGASAELALHRTAAMELLTALPAGGVPGAKAALGNVLGPSVERGDLHRINDVLNRQQSAMETRLKDLRRKAQFLFRLATAAEAAAAGSLGGGANHADSTSAQAADAFIKQLLPSASERGNFKGLVDGLRQAMRHQARVAQLPYSGVAHSGTIAAKAIVYAQCEFLKTLLEAESAIEQASTLQGEALGMLLRGASERLTKMHRKATALQAQREAEREKEARRQQRARELREKEEREKQEALQRRRAEAQQLRQHISQVNTGVGSRVKAQIEEATRSADLERQRNVERAEKAAAAKEAYRERQRQAMQQSGRPAWNGGGRQPPSRTGSPKSRPASPGPQQRSKIVQRPPVPQQRRAAQPQPEPMQQASESEWIDADATVFPRPPERVEAETRRQQLEEDIHASSAPETVSAVEPQPHYAAPAVAEEAIPVHNEEELMMEDDFQQPDAMEDNNDAQDEEEAINLPPEVFEEPVPLSAAPSRGASPTAAAPQQRSSTARSASGSTAPDMSMLEKAFEGVVAARDKMRRSESCRSSRSRSNLAATLPPAPPAEKQASVAPVTTAAAPVTPKHGVCNYFQPSPGYTSSPIVSSPVAGAHAEPEPQQQVSIASPPSVAAVEAVISRHATPPTSRRGSSHSRERDDSTVPSAEKGLAKKRRRPSGTPRRRSAHADRHRVTPEVDFHDDGLSSVSRDELSTYNGDAAGHSLHGLPPPPPSMTDDELPHVAPTPTTRPPLTHTLAKTQTPVPQPAKTSASYFRPSGSAAGLNGLPAPPPGSHSKARVEASPPSVTAAVVESDDDGPRRGREEWYSGISGDALPRPMAVLPAPTAHPRSSSQQARTFAQGNSRATVQAAEQLGLPLPPQRESTQMGRQSEQENHHSYFRPSTAKKQPERQEPRTPLGDAVNFGVVRTSATPQPSSFSDSSQQLQPFRSVTANALETLSSVEGGDQIRSRIESQLSRAAPQIQSNVAHQMSSLRDIVGQETPAHGSRYQDPSASTRLSMAVGGRTPVLPGMEAYVQGPESLKLVGQQKAAPGKGLSYFTLSTNREQSLPHGGEDDEVYEM